MGLLDNYITDTGRIAPTGDDNIQQRRILYYLAHMAQEGVSVNLNGSDIQIGAAELKDGTSDARAKVTNASPGANDYGLVVRPLGDIGITGNVTVIQGTPANLQAAVSGSQGHDAVIADKPIIQGLRAINVVSLPSAVSFGDLVYGGADEYGRFIVRQADLVHTSDTVGVIGKGVSTSGGLTRARVTNLTTTAQAIKAASGNLYRLWATNPHASDAAWLCLYNIAAASVTVGTSALYTCKIEVPASKTVICYFETHPIYFDTAIAIAATKLIADNDTTAPTSNLSAMWAYA